MDVVTIGDESYRVLPGRKGLYLSKIGKDESNTKLLKISDKRVIKKGKFQLSMHDGRNIVADGTYRTNDTLVFDVAQKKIRDTIKLEKGCTSLITGGKNIGTVATVEEIIITQNSMPNQVVIDINGRKIMLPRDYVFAVGKDKPAIKIGETR
jgi:small subunit ribosomal protein S4e